MSKLNDYIALTTEVKELREEIKHIGTLVESMYYGEDAESTGDSDPEECIYNENKKGKQEKQDMSIMIQDDDKTFIKNSSYVKKH